MTFGTKSPKQLSDQNSQGTLLGASASDAVGFFGGTPVPQPSNNSLVPVTRGQQSGIIATFHSQQSPALVAANTTAEQTLTVQTGTGAPMQLATTDLILAVNKPTAQAGLGYGNARVSSANTLGLTLSNATGSGITPTAAENYQIVAVRGLPTVSLVLSPAAVPANTTLEQVFSIVPATSGASTNVGIPAGTLVFVSKPTAQAGLDIVGVRAVANNQIGITYANFTNASITPTASETYTVYALFGLDALNSSMQYNFNVGTVGAIGAGVVASAGNTTLTGMLATDIIAGVQKPTNGAAATNAAFVIGGVPAANALTLYYGGIGTGATPTANEVYGIHAARLNPAAPLLVYNQKLAPVSVAANTTAEQTFTVTGLVAGSPVWLNKPSAQGGLGIVGVRVSAANTLAITFANLTGSAIVPSTETYTIGNFQVPAPGAGNAVYQAVSTAQIQAANLANGMRAALGAAALNLVSQS